MATPPQFRDWSSRHLWHIQPIRDLLVIAAAFGLIYLGYRLSIVTVPILLALALAYLVEPLVRKVSTQRRLVSRQGAALGIILLAVLVVVVPVGVGGAYAVVQGISTAQRLASNAERVRASVAKPDDPELAQAVSPGWRWIREELVSARKRVTETSSKDRLIDTAITWVVDNAQAIGTTVGQKAVGTGVQAFSIAARTLGSLGMLVFGAFLTAFFFYFFCTEYGRVLAFWEGLIPEQRRGRTVELLQKMDRVIAGFVRGRLLICLILSVVVTAAYVFIGVPVPLLLGPLVGLLFLVPFMHIIGMPIAMVAMWLEPSGSGWQTAWWWVIGAPVGVNLLCQVLDDYILTPIIQGKNMDIATPTILFASIAGGTLAGFYGVLLAIPVAACLKIAIREVMWPRVKLWVEGRERDFLPISEE
ncbi:MAG: AI-2E family transporter [Phycisphaerales bacterium]